MRRTLILPLLVAFAGGPLALPAAAQPWASEPVRLAGRQALAAAQAGRWLEAESLALAADPLAAKVIRWWRMQQRPGTPDSPTAAQLVTWLEENPDWPLPETLARRAEDALAQDPDDALVLRHFARRSPRTLEGAQRLADALARAGRGAEAATVLRSAWGGGLTGEPGFEAEFAERNAAQLSTEHARRFDLLVWGGQVSAAARMLPRLDAAPRALAELRLALRAEREVPVPATRDLGLIFEQARLLRRRDRDAEAAALWHQAEALQGDLPPEAARAIWTERQILARKLLRLGDAAAAYRTAAAHGQAEPSEARQEGEFLAGFIALRRLNDPAAARRHFAMVGQDSRSVITRARSAYWEGLALQAAGRAADARARFEAAAALPVAIYGQLASIALGESPAQLAARIASVPSAAPDEEAARHFGMKELARAAVTLADLGQSDRARMFLLRLEELSPTAGDRWLVARTGVLIGRPDHAVWIARRAGADGVILLEDGWPIPWPAPETGAEPALVYAITRQESNFDPSAISSANARGPMQLLPSTAQMVARRLGIAHSTGMLTSNPTHNLLLGSAYIAEMLSRFDGAVALATAAYNAGPRRVDEWLATYGDPRQPDGPDIRDWIEMIPFGETRNYVQRVVENMVIYRAREPATAALPHPLAAYLR